MTLYGKPNRGIQPLIKQLANCPIKLRWSGPTVEEDGVLNGKVPFLDGLETLQALQRANVAHTLFTTYPEVRDHWTVEGHLVLGRTLNHQTQDRGLDIICQGGSLQNNKRWRSRPYWTLLSQCGNEAVIYVIKRPTGTYVVAGWGFLNRVQPLRPLAPEERWKYSLRTAHNGWAPTASVNSSLPLTRKQAAKAAVQACGYELASVSMLWESGYIVDVDPHPALTSNFVASTLTNALRVQVRGGGNAED